MADRAISEYLHQSVIEFLKTLPPDNASCLLTRANRALIVVKSDPEQSPRDVEGVQLRTEVYRAEFEDIGPTKVMLFQFEDGRETTIEVAIPFSENDQEGMKAYLTLLQQDIWYFYFVSNDVAGLHAYHMVKNNLVSEERQQLIGQAQSQLV